ncbi:MAG: hypothetical protein IT373_13425 [Polyangiaceae bacterium]|nr:hypothetical protein [Polyangiaceae bacterium]
MRRTTAWRSAVGAVVAVLAGVAVEHEVQACECVDYPPLVRPSATDLVVAANTKIWLEGPGVGSLTCGPLLDAAQQTVPTTRTELATRGVRAVVFTPVADLGVGAAYSLECDHYGQKVVSSFTVTEPADDTAPAVPLAELGEAEHDGSGSSSCGEADYVPVTLQHEGGIVVVDIAGQGVLDATGPSGTVNDVYADDGYLVGGKICGRHHNWDFDDDGAAEDVRFGTFDLAGNFSGWSEPQEVSVGCSCRLGPTSSGAGDAAAVAGLALVGLARLRRRPARS